jgi:transposase
MRVIDACIDELDLVTFGFERVIPKETVRPGYHPAILLKICVYGHLETDDA